MTEMFKGFGDPNRLRILNLLANRGETCVCDLEQVLGLPQTRISKHLNALKGYGLVHSRREGTWMHYSLTEAEGSIHFCQLDCLRCCFPKLDTFAHDLEVYDSLRKSGGLACCTGTDAGPGQPTNPSLNVIAQENVK